MALVSNPARLFGSARKLGSSEYIKLVDSSYPNLPICKVVSVWETVQLPLKVKLAMKWNRNFKFLSSSFIKDPFTYIKNKSQGWFWHPRNQIFLECWFPSKIKKIRCFKPPVPLSCQKTHPLHEILITENAFERCFQ